MWDNREGQQVTAMVVYVGNTAALWRGNLLLCPPTETNYPVVSMTISSPDSTSAQCVRGRGEAQCDFHCIKQQGKIVYR